MKIIRHIEWLWKSKMTGKNHLRKLYFPPIAYRSHPSPNDRLLLIPNRTFDLDAVSARI
jgi:hypothetical protein